MPDLKTLEQQETPELSKPRSATRQWHWQWLLAPLMGISVVFHIALLFVPLPSLAPQAAEVEEPEVPEEEEDDPIDILSLSDIEVPEPPSEPLAEPAPSEATAPPPDAVPPPPDPNQVPDTLPESLPEDQLPEATGPEETPPASTFDPARQQALLGQAGGINAEFDQTQYFPLYAWNPANQPAAYLAGWDPQRLNCFFSLIDEMNYELDPRAGRLKYLTRNYGLIVNEDLPRTFPGQQVVPDPNGYCGEDFFVINENGAPAGVYVSAIGVGEGNPPANVILVFWVEDPR